MSTVLSKDKYEAGKLYIHTVNYCLRCGKPLNNRVFTVCDECWDDDKPKTKQVFVATVRKGEPRDCEGDSETEWFASYDTEIEALKAENKRLKKIISAAGQTPM